MIRIAVHSLAKFTTYFAVDMHLRKGLFQSQDIANNFDDCGASDCQESTSMEDRCGKTESVLEGALHIIFWTKELPLALPPRRTKCKASAI